MKRACKSRIKISDEKRGRLPFGVVDEDEEESFEDDEELGKRTRRTQVR